MVQRRLDYLPLILNGGYVMMVFQRMHLDSGKRNCKCYTMVDEVYKYSNSSNLELFKQDRQLTNCTLTFKGYICRK